MGALAEAGVTLVGENRLQDLEQKRERWGDAFEWDFIGNLQSRKVKRIVPLVRLVHSVATDSVLEQLATHAEPETEILVEVDLAGEESKGGVAPGDLAAFIDRSPVAVTGLMTMPPATASPEASRAVLREAGRARHHARPDAAVDGDEPGLGGRRRRRARHPARSTRSSRLGSSLFQVSARRVLGGRYKA